MAIVRTSSKGQVVIPAEIRREIGLEPGDRVQVSRIGKNRVLVQPIPDDPVEAARGILRDGPSLTEALKKERDRERDREEEKSARLLRDSGVSQ
ncbi:MAG: AbrB/MazE/SpoVT family DNA-binding domain-containing protein [Gemmatimonadota bacterium]